jgi:hypothetical protein
MDVEEEPLGAWGSGRLTFTSKAKDPAFSTAFASPAKIWSAIEGTMEGELFSRPASDP